MTATPGPTGCVASGCATYHPHHHHASSTTTTVAPHPSTLPFTGATDIAPMAGVALALCLIGATLTRASRRKA